MNKLVNEQEKNQRTSLSEQNSDRSHALHQQLRPEGGGGGVKVDFPVFTYLIRAAGVEQEEKNRTEI